MRLRLWLFGSILTLFACNKTEYFGPVYSSGIDLLRIDISNILIGCEGNFQYSNASISVIQTDNWSLINNAYNSVNQKTIGDVLQSFKLKGDTLAVVLNNSSEVKFLNAKTLEQIGSYKGFISPRYIEFLNDSTVAVSDLYSDYISTFQVPSMASSRAIATNGWTEQLIKADSFLVAANIDRRSLQYFNLSDFELTSEIKLGFEPNKLFHDDNKNLIAVGKDSNEIYYCAVINSNQIISKIDTLDVKVSASDLFDNELYICTSKSVYKLDYVNSIRVKLFDHRAITPYGFRVSPSNDYVIINDAIDYISKGTCQFYSLKGELIREFKVGFIPQAIEFAL